MIFSQSVLMMDKLCLKFLYLILYCALMVLIRPVDSAAIGGGECRIDLVLVIDSSGSVQRVFKTYIAAALEFTKDLTFGPEAAHAAIVQYSKMPPFLKYSFDMPQSNEAINQAISQLEFLGDSTFTAEAVNLGIDQYSKNGRSDAKKIFVLMTDGNSINPWKMVLQTSKRLQNLQANVYIIALGDNLYFPELKLYTGNGSLITKDGLERFKAEVMDLGGCVPPTGRPTVQTPSTTSPITEQPTTSATSTTSIETYPPSSSAPSPPSSPSSAPISSSPAPPTSTSCPIPEGYCPCPSTVGSTSILTTTPAATTTTIVTEAPSTKPPIKVSPCAVDILFVLDSSGANRTNFDRQVRFILDLLDLLIIQPDAHLVSAVVYDGHLKQRIQFSFTAYKDIQSLSAAISALPFFGGTAATGEALTLAKQALKDRRATTVPALVFVVTNGTSTDDVTASAAALRTEPNTTIYSLSATDVVDKQQLATIAGDPNRVFAGMESENIKQVGLGKYLTCFKDNLNAKQRLFL